MGEKVKMNITSIVLGVIVLSIGGGIGRIIFGIIRENAWDAFEGQSPADIAYFITTLVGHYIPFIIGGGVAGLVCGLLPYFIGKRKNNKNLGKIALWFCFGAGLVLGIALALPIAIILSIVIGVKKSPSSILEEQKEPQTRTISKGNC